MLDLRTETKNILRQVGNIDLTSQIQSLCLLSSTQDSQNSPAIAYEVCGYHIIFSETQDTLELSLGLLPDNNKGIDQKV